MIRIDVNNFVTRFRYTKNIEIDAFEYITEAFKFPVKGREFSEKYQNYINRIPQTQWWDGTVELFRNNMIATGFLPVILKQLNTYLGNDLEYSIIDNRVNLSNFKSDIITSFGNYTLRDHQINMIRKCNRVVEGLYFPRGIIDAAPNAGKTIVGLFLYLNIIDCKMLFLVPTRLLLKQTYDKLNSVLPAGTVGRIGESETVIAPLTVGIINSTAGRLSKRNELSDYISKYFNTLVVDECHRAASPRSSTKSYYEIVSGRINAGCRIYVSGTPFRDDDPEYPNLANYKLIGQASNRIHTISESELINLGISRRPIIHLYLNRVPDHIKYQTAVEQGINLCENRNNIIIDLVKKNRDLHGLIAFKFRKHGQLLHGLLNSIEGLSVGYMDGDTPRIVREDLLKRFYNDEINALVLSLVGREGLDANNIDYMVYAAGGQDRTTVNQFMGRTARLHKNGSDTVNVYDFFDYGKHVTEHSIYRIMLYKEEGYEIIPHYKCNIDYIPN